MRRMNAIFNHPPKVFRSYNVCVDFSDDVAIFKCSLDYKLA